MPSKILLCEPRFYQIAYEINPWMRVSRGSDQPRALQQWQQLRTVLENLGVELCLMPPAPDMPDLTFTANAGLVNGNQVLLSHFAYKQRQVEQPHCARWFAQAGFDLMDYPADVRFEGAGDALPLNNHLLMGYGFRTDLQAQHTLAQFVKIPVIACQLVDPHFYHLDTCFCPLDTEQALWWPHAFSLATQELLKKKFKLWSVSAVEAQAFACNAVVVGRHVVLPTACPNTVDLLTRLGFVAHPCAMTEFLKAGGACKCLTLTLA